MATSPSGGPGRPCERCEPVRSTRRYATFHEPFAFPVLHCDSCHTPMAVLAEHRAVATEEERSVMQKALGLVVETMGLGEVAIFDDRMRQIPDHYHLHARIRPAWLRR